LSVLPFALREAFSGYFYFEESLETILLFVDSGGSQVGHVP